MVMPVHVRPSLREAPLRVNGRQPIFYVANRAHHADVGGAQAGSMGLAREIFQEGLRIPPVLLQRAGERLPADVRDELVSDIRAHLEEVRANAEGRVEVRDALDRLGAPEEVVRAAAAEVGDRQAVGQPQARSSAGLREIVTVLLLVFGVVVTFPILGPFSIVVWLVAVALLWSAPAWTPRLKTLGTLVWPGGIALPLATGLVTGQTCMTVEESNASGVVTAVDTVCSGYALPVWIGLPLFIVLLAAPVVVGVVLLRRAHRQPVTG